MTTVEWLPVAVILICGMLSIISYKGRQLERRIKALEDKNKEILEQGLWGDYRRFKELYKK